MDDWEAITEENEASQPSDKLDELRVMAEKAVALEVNIAEIEALLKDQKTQLHQMKTKTIPEKMDEIGMPSFALNDGTELKVEDFVSGSMPKEDKAPEKFRAAMRELKARDGEDLVKNQMTLVFDKKQHNQALALADELRSQGYDVDLKSSVHPQTLCKFVREKIAAGDPIDYEALGCFVGRVTKIKLPSS